jgi:cadmium resistance protein CadD (predicted permease)
MQKIATRIFVYSSLAFGVIGILLVLSNADDNSEPNKILMKLLLTTVFIILPSFAVSVAGKYLNGNF